jgi:hypothetical protein
VALATAVAAYAAVLDTGSAPVGGVAVLLLAGALLWASGGTVPWALALLIAAYALALALHDRDLDARAGFVAAALLLAGELAFWSVEAKRWPREQSAAARARLAGALILALAAATLGTLLVAAGAAVPSGVSLVQAIGAFGAVVAVLTLALLARR